MSVCVRGLEVALHAVSSCYVPLTLFFGITVSGSSLVATQFFALIRKLVQVHLKKD